MEFYKQLSLEERNELFVMRRSGTRVKDMAMIMGRHKSTFYREFARNTLDNRISYLPDCAASKAKKGKYVLIPPRKPCPLCKIFLMCWHRYQLWLESI